MIDLAHQPDEPTTDDEIVATAVALADLIDTVERAAETITIDDARAALAAAISTAPMRIEEDDAASSALLVVVVDGPEEGSRALAGPFEAPGDVQVVGEAFSMAEGLALVLRLQPDVLVTMVRLRDGDGIALTRLARNAVPPLGIVVVSAEADDQHLFAALDAGASAFIGQDEPPEELLTAARHAQASPRAFTARDLAGAMRRRTSAPAGPKLSLREREVLALLVEGLAVAQVARRLHITEATVKTHVARIYEKLGTGNRAQAVMEARHRRLIDDD